MLLTLLMNLGMFGPALGGKGDNEERSQPFKPTGLLHRPKKAGRREPADRIDESREIQVEIAGRLAREFTKEPAAPPPPRLSLERPSLAEVDREIGVLLRKKLKKEEEVLLILLIASA